MVCTPIGVQKELANFGKTVQFAANGTKHPSPALDQQQGFSRLADARVVDVADAGHRVPETPSLVSS